MNDLEFKHHLKDLAHGHHHPEEHDWGQAGATKKPAPPRTAGSKPRTAGKTAKKKK